MKKTLLTASVAALFGLSPDARADQLTFTTATPVGSEIKLAFNANLQATLTWGNGEVQEMTFTGKPQSLKIVDATCTVKSDMPITMLDVTGCKITELKISNSPNLESLSCANNQLSALTTSRNTALAYLDCENNLFENLNVYRNTELQELNCANNQLKNISVNGLRKLKTLICTNNQISDLAISSLDNLETLWCQGNQLTELDLTDKPRLKQVLASQNQLDTIMTDNNTSLNTMWVDHNRLSELDLRSTSGMKFLSADHNQLERIRLNPRARTGWTHYYVHNNHLAFNSFPAVYDEDAGVATVVSVLDEQDPITLPDVVFEGKSVDFNSYIRANAFNMALTPVVTWKYQETDETVDPSLYTTVNYGKYTFPQKLGMLYAQITAPQYPGVELRTTAVHVASVVGIGETTADNSQPAWRITAGNLSLTATQTTDVKVYDAQGRLVVNTRVQSGNHSWNLPAGIYIANGVKLQIP